MRCTSAQGLYAKAEPLYQRALAISEKALGPEHPDTATSLNNLAVLYNNQGLYAKAEPLYQRALAISEKALGPEHPATATSLNNLAVLYDSQGLYAKAEPLYQRALAISEKALGPEHPDTATSLNNLAALYDTRASTPRPSRSTSGLWRSAKKRWGQSTRYRHQPQQPGGALRQTRASTPRPSPSTSGPWRSMKRRWGPSTPIPPPASTTWRCSTTDQGLYAKAEPLYQRALAINEKALGPEHPDTATSLNNLAVSMTARASTPRPSPSPAVASAVEFTLIQREAPYSPGRGTPELSANFGNTYEIAFSSAQRGSSGANLALFSRLNRQGLLQEIEQRQAQLASLPGPQQALANELRAVTQQLASMALSPEQRQQLKGRQEELEKQLYRLLPQLQPRVVEVQQVAAALPAGSALIEFQRYSRTTARKPQDQRWGEARYLALVLKPDGAITPIDLGLAKPIDASIQAALEASEQKQADALELWAQVGRSVLDPLSAATRGVNTLFISPDGELNRVPFAALPAPGSSQLLSEALQLRLLTTGRELLDLQNTPNGKTSQALVVANPAFDRTPVSVQSPRLAVSSQQRSGDLGSSAGRPCPAPPKKELPSPSSPAAVCWPASRPAPPPSSSSSRHRGCCIWPPMPTSSPICQKLSARRINRSAATPRDLQPWAAKTRCCAAASSWPVPTNPTLIQPTTAISPPWKWRASTGRAPNWW